MPNSPGPPMLIWAWQTAHRLSGYHPASPMPGMRLYPTLARLGYTLTIVSQNGRPIRAVLSRGGIIWAEWSVEDGGRDCWAASPAGARREAGADVHSGPGASCQATFLPLGSRTQAECRSSEGLDPVKVTTPLVHPSSQK